MDVILLGTGSPLPNPHRAGPSTLVQAGNARFLVDCGRGVVMRLAAAGVLPGMLSAVLLTHLHSDHVTDLNDVITTRWAMSPVPLPLRIIGPVGTKRLVDATLAMLADDIGWRLAHHDDLHDAPEVHVEEFDAGQVWADDRIRIVAAPTDHRPVHPTLGYRFEADDSAVVIAGDTIPCAGLDALCEAADMYVQTVVRRDLIESIPSARLQDVLDYHSTVEQAGDTAQRAGVGVLVLTHMVPPVAPGAESQWSDLAATTFSGRVLVGEDLMVIPARRRDSA
jgi:ribonuclease Z